MKDNNIKIININNYEDMIKFGEKLGALSFPNMVITMEGDLGAGKTTITKGIGKGLNITRVINSPTFTIMKIYEGRLPLYHMDVYRIDNNSGDDYLEEYFELGGVTVIEWANNIDAIIPNERLQIEISINDDTSRTIKIFSNNPKYIDVINKL